MSNKKLIALADAIENDSVPNMSFVMWTLCRFQNHILGSRRACIGGYVLALFQPESVADFKSYTEFSHSVTDPLGEHPSTEMVKAQITKIMADLLDEDRDLELLFYPDSRTGYYYTAMYQHEAGFISRSHAVAAIRRLVGTGQIDWKAAKEDLLVAA